MATFADRLNEALLKRGMSAAELSRLAEVNEGAISQYRRGKYKASQYAVHRIAKVLNVPIAWLMGMVDDSPFERNSSSLEQELLRKYRALSPDHQQSLLAMLDTLYDLDNKKDGAVSA